MEATVPVERIDPKNAVLFLGSGFSAKAKNIANEEVPAGHGLLQQLASALGENPDELDLKSAADAYARRFDISLYDLLYKTFTVCEAQGFQREILALPWARIYTTNYDDIVSLVKGPTFPIFTFDDARPTKLPPTFVAHLHGSIRKANEENASDQLILNTKSYDTISHTYPDWFHEFQRDRRNFDACFFMGFSLADHHISGLMSSGEESVKRTFFISRPNPSPTFRDRASQYGEVVDIGFEAFAILAKDSPSTEPVANIQALQSFKYLRPGLDSKPLAEPTSVEIINLVTFGTFSQNRFFNTKKINSYVAGRDKHIQDALESLKTNKTILVHSRLGNGKTIFTSILALRATTDGYKCFLWRRADRRLAQELEALAAEKRVLILFDGYDDAVENIERVSTALPDAKFVVTIRTSQQEVRLHEVVKTMPSPMKRMNIDAFSKSDRDQLHAILNQSGVRAEGLDEVVRASTEIRDVVTKLYDHSGIRDKIRTTVAKAPLATVEIITLACLIKWTGVELEDNELQLITGSDIYAELRTSGVLAMEFLTVSDDKVEMRSSLLAEYLIQKILEPKSVLSACYNVTTFAIRKRLDRTYRRLFSELMKFSTLQRFMRFHPDMGEELSKHYDRLSHDIDVNAEPLFWLQYAILMKNKGDIRSARFFLNTGYDRANEIDGFKKFQLDTQALSIYLREEIESDAVTVEGFDDIAEAIKTVSDMISDQSHRRYVIEVIGEVPAFIEARGTALQEPEKIALVIHLNGAARALAALSKEDQVYTGSEIVRARLEKAISQLTGKS
jgi:hypothetical protein